jgi:hypothetical protein
LFENAHACLKKFVEELATHYGPEIMVYNMHGLLHLPDFVKSLGLLDFWSAYKFENFLQIIKKRIRSPVNVLVQLGNRFSELEVFGNRCETSFCISPNDVFLTDKGVVQCTAYEDEKIIGFPCTFEDDIYKSPYPSSILGIGIYKLQSYKIQACLLSKCVSFEQSDGTLIIFPLSSSDL